MAIETESRRLIKVEADNREYLRAVAAMERADKAAAAKRDAALAKGLSEQKKLTEETFKTAKAQLEQGKSLDQVLGKQTLLNKAYEVGAQRIKAMGMSLLAGFGAGVIGGILGGSVTSLVQKAFAPPTDAELLRMSRASAELKLFGIAVRDIAKEEINRRRHAEVGKRALDDVAQAAEKVTHRNAILQLVIAERELGEQYKRNEIDARQYHLILKELRKVEKEWTESPGGNYTVRRLATDPLTGRPITTEEQIRRSRQERARAQAEAARERRERNVAAIRPWFEDQLAGLGATSAAGRQGQAYMEGLNRDRARVAREAQEGSADFYARAHAAEDAQKKGEKLSAMAGAVRYTTREIELAAAAWDVFANAATSAYEAVISGQLSLGKAVKRLGADVVGGLGKMFFVEFLGESAQALKSLAFRDFSGAAKHGKAAAGFLGASVVAGGIAASMGGGGSARGGGGGYGGGGAPGPARGPQDMSGGSGGREQVHVHILADARGESSPRFQREKALRAAALISDTNGS